MQADDVKFGGGATEYGNLFILGNGFDLDLGFPTSYKHFYENDNAIGNGGFPFVKGGMDYSALGRFVLEHACINGWFSLEDVLAKYGSRRVFSNGESPTFDKEDYLKLVSSLSLYLKSIDYSTPNKDSVAARVLKALCDCMLPPTVYTFNYTDITAIADTLGSPVGNVSFIHGSLSTNDIVLGVGDYAKLTSSYDFMYKTSNPQYKSTDLFHELDICDNILFFGLSLSQVDYPYFEDFFKKIASGAYGAERKKFIRIFTYDEASRMEILRNLRDMNEGMIALYNYADFDIVRTKDNLDEGKVAEIINKIENEWQLDV